MKIKTDIKAGYSANSPEDRIFELPRPTMDDLLSLSEESQAKPYCKTGHAVSAILE